VDEKQPRLPHEAIITDRKANLRQRMISGSWQSGFNGVLVKKLRRRRGLAHQARVMATNSWIFSPVRPPDRAVARSRFGILCGLLLSLSGTLAGQPASRADAIAAEQAEKARNLQPPTPGKAEEWVLKAEALFLVDPSGFFPYF